LIREAGFKLLAAGNLTDSTALISRRWHDARDGRREHLVKIEGEAKLQRTTEVLGMHAQIILRAPAFALRVLGSQEGCRSDGAVIQAAFKARRCLKNKRST
jgi:hypothetical protein